MREDDRLPLRFFRKSLGIKKNTIIEPEFEQMKGDYYGLRGWNARGEPFKV